MVWTSFEIPLGRHCLKDRGKSLLGSDSVFWGELHYPVFSTHGSLLLVHYSLTTSEESIGKHALCGGCLDLKACLLLPDWDLQVILNPNIPNVFYCTFILSLANLFQKVNTFLPISEQLHVPITMSIVSSLTGFSSLICIASSPCDSLFSWWQQLWVCLE